MPPWLQEQIMKLQQSQQKSPINYALKNNILKWKTQKQQKLLKNYEKVADGDTVFKHAGTVLIKSTKEELIA